jgi:hypothetical protein
LTDAFCTTLSGREEDGMTPEQPARRSTVTDLTVIGEDGRIVALFRGASRQTGGTYFEEEAAADG